MKKEKVIITGSLGYLGSELCKLYSGETRFKEIVCIDNRFVSERVSQLRSWGMTFIQGSILDKELMSKHLHDADVVYHLAGETSVAYTKTESNSEQDKLIKDHGFIATRQLLQLLPKTCKVIFPSSHVVYEGYSSMFDIGEDLFTAPILTYSTGKAVSETDLSLSDLDHVIVRLGSVYGYSTDTMRINIMPNLFSKTASQNGTISLYGKGVQYKSLVNVIDVVRAMKFLAESDHIGTYHLSNENMTVKEVAELCKEINPAVTLVETDDEIPNLGYTLSNQKLLSTGFRFLYNIKDSIKEMITQWSAKEQPKELEYILRGQKEYIDERGKISNYELTESINLIGYIESVAGSVRANHYHPIQEQKCLLIKGRYISVIKDLSYQDAPIEYKIINSGDIAVIQSNIAHTMVFLEDSLFLNLVRGEREHENYGITHTIPYILVDEEERVRLITSELGQLYISKCRVCGGKNLEKVVDLGNSPLANNLVDDPTEEIDIYPLELNYCTHCSNVQLSVAVPPKKMFDNYLYVSSTSATFRKHFENAAIEYISEFGLTRNSLVLDIGSNDGVFLKPLKDKGIKVCGIEPAQNVCDIANASGVPTVHGYFTRETAHKSYELYGSPDLITAFNVFAHTGTIEEITNTVFSLLKPNGVFIVEVQYLIDTIKDMTFDNIYHEHVNYWSVIAFNHFFHRLGFCLYKVTHIDTHGGSIRCYVSRDKRDNTSVLDYIDNELRTGITDIRTFKNFGKRIVEIKKNVLNNMNLLKEKYPSIVGYGSPAKATTALNYYGIDGSLLSCTIDDNALKQNKYIPGTGIQIVQHVSGQDLIVVLAWNFFNSIKQKLGNQPCISIKDLEQRSSDLPLLDSTTFKGTDKIGKVYDCFIFFNELDLLELRLNIMNELVDYFVIVESNITHSGQPKEFVFEENKKRFKKFLDKIIYIKVTDIPEDFTRLSVYHSPENYEQDCHNRISSYMMQSRIFKLEETVRAREQYQRSCIIKGLEGCQGDDVIMLSDLDEITNPIALSKLLSNFDNSRVYGMRQNSYYYYVNLLKEHHWVGARVATYGKFCQYSPIDFRHVRDVIVADGGWHFSFLGNAEQVLTKLQAYSHCDMVSADTITNLPQRIYKCIDPYNRGKLTPVGVDNTYPQYFLDNIHQYRHMIL